MPLIKEEVLRKVGVEIFKAAGAPEEYSKIVTHHLVEADLAGQSGHGVARIPSYVEMIRYGKPVWIKPANQPRFVRESRSTALIDGNFTFGQVACEKAMDVALKKVQEAEVVSVGIFNCTHIGRLGGYALKAVAQDKLCFITCNAGFDVAPYGAAVGMIGTNPFCFGIPAGKYRPIILDFATSATTRGRLLIAQARKEKVPEGWIIDAQGRPTTDPNAFFGPPPGAILPFGGYKGYGLAVVAEVLGGILTGSGWGKAMFEKGAINGTFITILDINAFQPINRFKEEVDRFIEAVKNAPKAPGVDRILMPGEPEFETAEKRRREGIPIEDTTWQSILTTAKELRLDPKKLTEL